MINQRNTVCSAFVLLLAMGGGAHAGAGASSIQLFELKPPQGNPFGSIARAKPKTNPRAPSRITNIRPDADALRYPAGAVTKNGVVNDTRRDFGSFGIPYTTTRVQEGVRGVEADDANRLSTTYPYSAVGQLGDTEGGFCSASVITRGIVVTAAHCVFGDETDGLGFWPGYYNGEGGTETTQAPYGIWTVFRTSVPASSSSEDESGCVNTTENDVAVLAISPNEEGAFIGDVVGTLGYGWNNYSFVSSENTGDLSVAAVTTLGYPALMDDFQIMQRTDGPTYAVTITPDHEFGCEESDIRLLQQGSNFTGGSSGGPWVVNFSGRNAELGVAGGEEEGEEEELPTEVGEAPLMAVIGVTSFGAPDPNQPKDNFSSPFGQTNEFPEEDYGGYGAGNIGALMQEICESEAPEGGTLASQGYCDVPEQDEEEEYDEEGEG